MFSAALLIELCSIWLRQALTNARVRHFVAATPSSLRFGVRFLGIYSGYGGCDLMCIALRAWQCLMLFTILGFICRELRSGGGRPRCFQMEAGVVSTHAPRRAVAGRAMLCALVVELSAAFVPELVASAVSGGCIAIVAWPAREGWPR